MVDHDGAARETLLRGFTIVEATTLSSQKLPVIADDPSAKSAPVDQDWELIRCVANGDESAFSLLVDRHQGRVLSVCHRLLGDPDLARDACQEVFLKLFRHADRFEPRARVSTWLYRIATNYCLNRLRRRKIVRWFSLDGAGDEVGAAFEPSSEAAGPEEQALQRERWAMTRQAIDSLPPNQKSVLVLAKFEGLSYREISEVLEISLGAVESRLFRAMRRIEKVLPA